MWICPTCKSKDHLEVVIETWAKLIQPNDEPEAFETDLDEAKTGHDHEWSENSVMQCCNPDCTDNRCHIAAFFDQDNEDLYGNDKRCDYDAMAKSMLPPTEPVRPADSQGHDAWADQGLMVDAKTLAEQGPVIASIEAAEKENQ